MSPAKRKPAAGSRAGTKGRKAAPRRKAAKKAPARKAAARSSTRPAPETSQRVSKLRSGTVIDHLPAGTGLRCLALLGAPREGIVTLGLNYPSRRLRRKDMLKVENRALSTSELARLALFGPKATVSIIEDYQVVRKIALELPTVLDDVLACPNPSCITHHDPVTPRVRVENRDPLRLRCHYCERRIRREEIELL